MSTTTIPPRAIRDQVPRSRRGQCLPQRQLYRPQFYDRAMFATGVLPHELCSTRMQTASYVGNGHATFASVSVMRWVAGCHLQSHHRQWQKRCISVVDNSRDEGGRYAHAVRSKGLLSLGKKWFGVWSVSDENGDIWVY